MAEVYCGSEPCPLFLNSTCVFYTGESLLYIGVQTNDTLEAIIVKINQAFQNTGIGYAFTNGVIQPTPSQPVQLGGALIQNTTIGGNFTLTFSGNVQAARHITTGGSSSQFVKGDGTLDSTEYQPAANYITGLSGDATASGPGVAAMTLATVNFASGTFGNGNTIPIVTVNAKGLVTNITPVPVTIPPLPLNFIGDVVGSGLTGSNITLLLQNVNPNPYNTITPLKFSVNGKGLVTSASPITASDIVNILGYYPGTSGTTGTSGTSGTTGTSGTSGTSGSDGTSGTSGTTGTSGTSGTDGSGGTSGTSGTSATAGTSGTSGTTGTSGTSATSGTSGTSGTDGTGGTSGTSGTSATAGTSGTSGSTGTSGTSGTTGTSGSSGTSGSTGTSGSSGTTGTSGSSGTTGTSGSSGTSGTTGTSGSSGTSGTTGTSGTSGLSGDRFKTSSTTTYTLQSPGGTGTITVEPGLAYTVAQSVIISYDAFNYVEAEVSSYDSITGVLNFIVFRLEGSGTYSSWFVNIDGASGGDGSSGSSGTSGTSATAGTSGTTGTSGSSGTSGTTGTSGSSGTSGTSATDGTGGTSGTSGSSGTSGTTGTSGTSATSGTSGTSATSGTTGTSGTSGTNGTGGTSGTSGSSATSGTSGTSGSSGTTPVNQVTGTGTAGQVSYWSSSSSITGESAFLWDATNNRLGIGVTPTQALDVVGKIKATDDLVLAQQNPAITFDNGVSGTLRIFSSFAVAAIATFNSTGGFRLNSYGTGAITGTRAYDLAVDASGNVIEVAVGAGTVTGSGTSGQVAFWNGSSSISGESNFLWDASLNKLTTTNGSVEFRGVQQDAGQIILTLGANNASGLAKNLYVTLIAGGTPEWQITTGAAGTDSAIKIIPNGTNGLTVPFGTTAASFSNSLTVGDDLFVTDSVAISGALGLEKLAVYSSMAKVSNGAGWGMVVQDTNTDGLAGRGGAIAFGAYRTDSGRFNAAAVAGAKSNSTGGNEDGDLVLYSSVASSLTERVRVLSAGRVLMGPSMPTDDGSSALQVSGGNIRANEQVVTYRRFVARFNDIQTLAAELYEDGASTNGGTLTLYGKASGTVDTVISAAPTKLNYINNAANVMIGWNTDQFYKLAVNGDFYAALDARVGGNLGVGAAPISGISLYIKGNGVDSPLLIMQGNANRVALIGDTTTGTTDVGKLLLYNAGVDTIMLSALANEESFINNSGGTFTVGATSSGGYKLAAFKADEDILRIHNTTTTGDALIAFTNADAGFLARIQGFDGGGLQFDVGNGAGGLISNALRIANTGAATFISHVNSGGWFTAPNNFGLEALNAAGTAGRVLIKLNSSNQIEIGRDSDISAIKLGTANTTDSAIITSAGNFGVGLLDPQQKIQSSGRIRVSPDNSNGGDLAVNDGGLALSAIGSSPIQFWRNNYNNLSMIIDSNGNLGVGTTNLPFRVNIESTSEAVARIKSTNASGAARLILNPEGAGAGSTGDASIFFDMNSTAWVTGVDKSDSSRFKIAVDPYGDFRAGVHLSIDNVTDRTNVVIGGTTALATSANRGNLTINGNSNSILAFGVSSSLKGYLYNNGTSFYMNMGAGDMIFEGNTATPLYLNQNGFVGIRTTPLYQLSVNGSNNGIDFETNNTSTFATSIFYTIRETSVSRTITTGGYSFGPANPLTMILTENSNTPLGMFYAANNADGAGLKGFKSRGTVAAPVSVSNGDTIFSMEGWAFHGSGPNHAKFGAGMRFVKDDAFGTANTFAPQRTEFYNANSTTTTITTFTILPNANCTAGGSMTATSFFESSDSRIKTLLDNNVDYSLIANVGARYYEKNGIKELGYFAQDFEQILPSAVYKDEKGLLNLSYTQVHTAKIAALEKEVRELKEQLKNK